MKKLTVLLLTCLCTIYMPLHAQEEFVQPQAKLLTKMSFTQLTSGIIILKAALDNYPDSLNFVFDTGSGGISLDSSTADKLQIPLVKSDRIIRGIAGMKTVPFANNHTLKLPNLKVDSLNFHINDYDLLTSVYGIKIDGIIGYSFLRRFIVRLNYDNQIMEIYSPGIFKYPKGGYYMRPNFTALPLPSVQVEDAKSIITRFIFDTGAGLCFLFSQDFVEDSLFLRRKRKIYATQVEGLGGKKRLGLTVIKNVAIGPYKFRKVPAYIFKDEFNVTSYPNTGGIIGNDLLKRFNVVINYPEQTIYLKPNNHYNEPFDYSYTGLGIYMVNGEVTVVDVIKESPAEKAGFMPGDIIFAVDNNFSKNIQQLKLMLQVTGSKRRVLIMRKEQPIMFFLDVKNILH